ncbi:MAG: phenylalanine--tRNA ligase subunit beta [Propionibacteriaceae bacterium]|nr:phenylalanine--tRNA ligase subunit beta [Propionibacteriaceae bacterium]
MKAPISWLRELVTLPEEATTQSIADAFTSLGLTVERIEQVGSPVTGPLVVGRVLSMTDEPQKNGKTIHYCRVDVGEEHNDPATDEYPASRGIVCGAHNFGEGDLVVVSLPGAVLPGDFQISARKTYGHISDGMICAEDEIGLGGDHEGIMVLQAGSPGDDAIELLWSSDDVLDIDVTPDLGHCLSMRGLAREAAVSHGVSYTDKYRQSLPSQVSDGHPVELETDRCTAFTALTLEGVDPKAPSPKFIVDRLRASGVRAISLAVDVTNYVMLESGQPLHAYDADKLQGAIRVRMANAGEELVTLDGQKRTLDTDDMLIVDDSGPIGLAGVMGGESTEISDATTRIVLEAAAFEAASVSRTFRRHGLISEASKRFERHVDPAVNYAAARRAAKLITQYGGGYVTGETFVGDVPERRVVKLRVGLISSILGVEVTESEAVRLLSASGVGVTALGDSLTLEIPTWRHDLVDPYDIVEELGTKIGYDKIGKRLPVAPAGGGLTPKQQARRDAVRAAAQLGFTQTMSLPFMAAEDLDRMGLPAQDVRRKATRLANPLSDAQPFLRTSLLPGLFHVVGKNVSRSITDLAVFEFGSVFLDVDTHPAPKPDVTERPSDEEIAALQSSLPGQPETLAGIVTGKWIADGWAGDGVAADWKHVVALADTVAAAVGLTLDRRQVDDVAPWHPGRTAALFVGETLLGYAGELHPQVIKAFELPERTCAVEIDFGKLLDAAPHAGRIGVLHAAPVAKEDVALIVDANTPAAEVESALVAGGGELLESVHLFDVYTGEQVGEGKKSLAFALRIRGEKTLKDAEAAEVRQAAVAAAAERCGAVQRA